MILRSKVACFLNFYQDWSFCLLPAVGGRFPPTHSERGSCVRIMKNDPASLGLEWRTLIGWFRPVEQVEAGGAFLLNVKKIVHSEIKVKVVE